MIGYFSAFLASTSCKKSAKPATHSSSSFKLGINLTLSPPFFSNSSLFSTAISSRVSKQSAVNEGQATDTFFIPFLLNLPKHQQCLA